MKKPRTTAALEQVLQGVIDALSPPMTITADGVGMPPMAVPIFLGSWVVLSRHCALMIYRDGSTRIG